MASDRTGNQWPTSSQERLLFACLNKKERSKKAWELWKSEIDFERIDPASFQLLSFVARNRDLEEPNDPIFEKCKGIYRRNWLANQTRWIHTLPFLEELHSLSVQPLVLLKGMAMTLAYYRDFGIRVMGDIDLLVPPEFLSLSVSILKKRQWIAKSLPIDPQNLSFLDRWNAANFTHEEKDLNLDLHWRPFLESSKFCTEIFLSYLEKVENTLFFVPSATEMLLQTCIHGMKQSPVPLIRWVVDAVTLLEKGKIDWDRLQALAKSCFVCHPLRLALTYLVERFEVNLPLSFLSRLQQVPTYRFERWEYRCNTTGHLYFAGWLRSCLRKEQHTLLKALFTLPRYLQSSALLTSVWHVPFYSFYWILKRLFFWSRKIALTSFEKAMKR